ncbi:secreted RxLR effector protein 78-like [Telopea speciosissima]|uniref:secreted RxLR effector protein 78-like n=1 Tax=Telopea speciosissima TaxID=54955 RepID=UPI001CC4519D|nr:secreted RxLR effector protein 78-like [Telopea speciosissima]
MLLKIDIHKAFDSSRWDFISQVMTKTGFPCIFVNWIQACISSPKFSVLVNGSLAGYFDASVGIRQGCPLSPYLFTMALEALSRDIQICTEQQLIVPMPKCKALNLSLLAFADDLMIFSKASLASLESIMLCLQHFHELLGLHINPSKSLIFFAGDSELDKAPLHQRSGF